MALFDLPRRQGGFSTLIGRIADWNDARQTRKQLSLLTPHELDDIGLQPGDIDRITTRYWR